MNEKRLEMLRNIGIAAHIDSGKTTLSERILYYTGRIRKMQEVHNRESGGAVMDSDPYETSMGITIKSAATHCEWKNHSINLIDTPGHVDFTIEVERALRVLDGAVLVLCAVGGVQSQTLTVVRQMRRYNVPHLVFVNKLDRPGASPETVVEQLREKLGMNAHPIQEALYEKDSQQLLGIRDLIAMEDIFFEGEKGEIVRRTPLSQEQGEQEAQAKQKREAIVEALMDVDETLAEKYLSGEKLTTQDIQSAIRRTTLAGTFTAVLMGSAFKNQGVQPLLDGVCEYLPAPQDREIRAWTQEDEETRLESSPDATLVMLAFKLDEGQFGQLSYVRIYQGSLKKGEKVLNVTEGKSRRVSRIMRMHADETTEIPMAQAGDVVGIYGLECASGDTLTDGSLELTLESLHVPEPVISLAVEPEDRESRDKFAKAIAKFVKEDPTFRFSRDAETGQSLIAGMGELHLDLYVRRMREEFDCKLNVGAPRVAYRETITGRADFDCLNKKQDGGSGMYAKIIGYMEPLPEGEDGFEFLDKTVGDKIPKDYMSGVRKGFEDSVSAGELDGAPVIGIRVVITDGATHVKDSNETAFRQCAQMAFRESYSRAGPILLEPVMVVSAETPAEFQGGVTGLLNQRRGLITGAEMDGEFCTLSADVPLVEMFGFSNVLRSATQGKAEFTMEFDRYEPAPKSVLK